MERTRTEANEHTANVLGAASLEPTAVTTNGLWGSDGLDWGSDGLKWGELGCGSHQTTRGHQL